MSVVKYEELNEEFNYKSSSTIQKNEKPKALKLLTDALKLTPRDTDDNVDFSNQINLVGDEPSTSGIAKKKCKTHMESDSDDDMDLRFKPASKKAKKPVNSGKRTVVTKKKTDNIPVPEDLGEEDEMNILDFSEESSDEDDLETNGAVDEDTTWQLGGWKVDSRKAGGGQPYGSRISLALYDECSELEYLLHFLPVKYINEVMLPATNKFASVNQADFKAITYKEFLTFLAVMYAMEVYKLPERRMYWATEDDGIFLHYLISRRNNLFLPAPLTSLDHQEILSILVKLLGHWWHTIILNLQLELTSITMFVLVLLGLKMFGTPKTQFIVNLLVFLALFLPMHILPYTTSKNYQ